MLAGKGTKIEMEPNETFLCASLDYSTKCNLRPTFTSLHKFLKTYEAWRLERDNGTKYDTNTHTLILIMNMKMI
jgi:hypothetical protein